MSFLPDEKSEGNILLYIEHTTVAIFLKLWIWLKNPSSEAPTTISLAIRNQARQSELLVKYK